MRFNKNGSRVRMGGKMPLNGRQPNTPDSKRYHELSFVGMQKTLAFKGSLHKFSYYDSVNKRCKLCYEEVYPSGSPEKGWVMINKLDGKFHRVWIGNKMYCKMAGK